MIYSIAKRLARADQDIDDIMHDVFLRVYEQRKKFDPKKSKFTTWVYRVSVNHAINITKRGRWPFIDFDLEKLPLQEQDDFDALEHLIKSGDSDRLRQALEKIPVKYRVCLVMKEIENLPYQEIADILSINIGTVRSHIYRAKEALRLSLKEA